jgi:hypothetical protein
MKSSSSSDIFGQLYLVKVRKTEGLAQAVYRVCCLISENLRRTLSLRKRPQRMYTMSEEGLDQAALLLCTIECTRVVAAWAGLIGSRLSIREGSGVHYLSNLR